MNKFFSKFKTIFLKVPLSEKILFTKHLAMMTKSSMSTVESLELIKRQVKSRSFRTILDKVAMEVENGQSLSTAFSRFRHIFGELFISIIALGESSGTLSENLEYLSSELKKSRQLRGKIHSAFVYPIII
ncbi:MAG: type II secretion system F family protein, partial [bacterium]|nr:type II secretion system F family protein [bacterium]